MTTLHNNKGISVIEVLIVLVIIGIITGLMLPRFQDTNSENTFKKDITYFIENVGKAQAIATSSNSRSCAETVNETLHHVEILITSSNQYKIIPYCILNNNPKGITPTPNSTHIMSFSTETTALKNTGSFASIYPDGSVTPGITATFGGTQSCDISISSTGVITNTCPQ